MHHCDIRNALISLCSLEQDLKGLLMKKICVRSTRPLFWFFVGTVIMSTGGIAHASIITFTVSLNPMIEYPGVSGAAPFITSPKTATLRFDTSAVSLYSYKNVVAYTFLNSPHYNPAFERYMLQNPFSKGTEYKSNHLYDMFTNYGNEFDAGLYFSRSDIVFSQNPSIAWIYSTNIEIVRKKDRQSIGHSLCLHI